jgi:protein subunit release factor B
MDDSAEIVISVRPSTPGPDGGEWAELLRSMYQMWASHKGYQSRRSEDRVIIAASAGDAASLRHEHGAHRLVRVSPFDPERRRCSTYAQVEVTGGIPADGPVRSYILDPYQLVRDARTGHEESDAAAVVNGALDAFLLAAAS